MQVGRAPLIKRVDISHLFDVSNRINEKVSELNGILSKALIPAIDLSQEIKSLDTDENKLITLLGARNKRGLINIVGDGLKVLFGTMSNDDALFFQEQIAKTQDSQAFIEGQFRTSARIMDELNSANKALRRNQEKEEQRLRELLGDLDKIRNEVTNEHMLNTARNIASSISRLIISTRMEVAATHNALLFIKAGVVDNFLLDGNETVSAIKQSDVGYEIEPEDMDELLRHSKITAFLNRTSKVIYIALAVPKTKKELFSLYQLAAVPQVKNNRIVIVSNYRKYLMIAEDSQMFWLGNEFNHYRIGKIIFSATVPMQRIDSANGCELGVLHSRTDARCVYNAWEEESQVLQAAGGAYLMLWRSTKVIEYDCPTERGNITITEPTLIKKAFDCGIKGRDFVIEKRRDSVKQNLENIVIQVECCSDFYLEKGVDNTTIKNSTIELEEIGEAEGTEGLKHSVDEFWSRNNNRIIYVGSPLMLGVVAALTIWIIMKYKECKSERNHRMINQVLFRLRESERGE